MLKLLVQSRTISWVQAEYRELGTLSGLQTAERIMMVRKTFERLACRFNERQAKAAGNGKPFIANGRQQTLQDELFGPLAGSAWPTRAAAALHGLRLNSCRPMGNHESPTGGRPVYEIDPHSYLAEIQVGPDQARDFGDYCGIAIYFDLLNSIEVAWIGPELELEKGWGSLSYETAGFTYWRHFRPEYQERLDSIP